MRVLVGCEFSGVVRDAFRARGHDAVSCDLIPSIAPGPHIQCDVRLLLDQPWDLAIFHPPCTYLAVSGLHWNSKVVGRHALTLRALDLVATLLDAPIPRIVLENPRGCISSTIKKYDQIIQPYQFGEDASKETHLWLKNVPPLKHTKYVPPRMVDGYPRWANQCDQGQSKLMPRKHRQQSRSITYQGIADAMAEQWSNLV